MIMALIDLSSGQVRVSRRFREKYQKIYGQHGIDLNKPFESEEALRKTLVSVTIRETLTEEEGNVLARALGLLKD
jgi:hypothetical protein